jgi:hypothetical protein
MSDEKDPKNPEEEKDVKGDGKNPDQDKPEPTHTQEEVDAIVQKRLARQKGKYSDYAELQEKAKELDDLKEAKKSETEKLQSKLDKANAERDAALSTADTTLITATFIRVASQLGVKHPEDAYNLADRTAVMIEEGKVVGVEEAVKALVKDGRLPLVGKPKAPGLDGGAGDGERSTDIPKLTPEQKEAADKMKVPHEDYAKNLVKE